MYDLVVGFGLRAQDLGSGFEVCTAGLSEPDLEFEF